MKVKLILWAGLVGFTVKLGNVDVCASSRPRCKRDLALVLAGTLEATSHHQSLCHVLNYRRYAQNPAPGFPIDKICQSVSGEDYYWRDSSWAIRPPSYFPPMNWNLLLADVKRTGKTLRERGMSGPLEDLGLLSVRRKLRTQRVQGKFHRAIGYCKADLLSKCKSVRPSTDLDRTTSAFDFAQKRYLQCITSHLGTLPTCYASRYLCQKWPRQTLDQFRTYLEKKTISYKDFINRVRRGPNASDIKKYEQSLAWLEKNRDFVAQIDNKLNAVDRREREMLNLVEKKPAPHQWKRSNLALASYVLTPHRSSSPELEGCDAIPLAVNNPVKRYQRDQESFGLCWAYSGAHLVSAILAKAQREQDPQCKDIHPFLLVHRRHNYDRSGNVHRVGEAFKRIAREGRYCPAREVRELTLRLMTAVNSIMKTSLKIDNFLNRRKSGKEAFEKFKSKILTFQKYRDRLIRDHLKIVVSLIKKKPGISTAEFFHGVLDTCKKECLTRKTDIFDIGIYFEGLGNSFTASICRKFTREFRKGLPVLMSTNAFYREDNLKARPNHNVPAFGLNHFPDPLRPQKKTWPYLLVGNSYNESIGLAKTQQKYIHSCVYQDKWDIYETAIHGKLVNNTSVRGYIAFKGPPKKEDGIEWHRLVGCWVDANFVLSSLNNFSMTIEGPRGVGVPYMPIKLPTFGS